MNNPIAFYKDKFDLQEATFLKIEHKDALVAIVYKINQANHKEYILKICPRYPDYLCEIYFLNNLVNKLPVPHIYKTIDQTEDTYGAILMEYLPGNLPKKTDLTRALMFEIGALLAKIHSNKVVGYGNLTQSNLLSLNPTSYFTLKFEEGIAECSNNMPGKLLNSCCQFYNQHVHLLGSVDGPCITHRDFRPGNILVNKGKVSGIIDWSSARGSFAEEDFCSLELGEWTNNPELKINFLKGYESIRKVPDYFKVMPCLLLSKAIATIGFTVKTGTWSNKNARLYQRSRRLLERILEIN
ncbi:phosphotransferase [Legionella micdadei]|uniref:phosphotransferase n=1 Tax=Legionella micdadei TaxID=451 RepID=UPI0009EF7488|nr:phosphotransferase [Legionella micdadei]ARG99086.1 hypothetical protein B6V88_00775 [Legionella micdadei]